MFINFWYCAATSNEIRGKPVKVRMLGQNFVLFRDSDGTAHCLHDVCIHRGASLAEGKLEDDCVECPYHGWRYDGSGACRHIPTLDASARIPSRERVKDWMAKGWRIDTDALVGDGGRSAFAIPSPARRSSGNWVIHPVPLVARRETARRGNSALLR
jgi:nitrite reductase/ring-hydroxylating ferredoxin subunit